MLRKLLLITLFIVSYPVLAADSLRVGVFDVDASPPLGSPLAYDPTAGVETPLSCRGLVILAAEEPIIICAIDWIGIANDGQRMFREALAEAAGTEPSRVAVHALHQHDAPRCDFSSEELLRQQYGLSGAGFDPAWAKSVISNAAQAVRVAVKEARPVSHLGLGQGEVKMVASNRRILGPDGKVQHVRWSATTDPAVREYPAGTIDRQLKLISFWHGDQPVAAISFYATHPQSYYRTGLANPDFPGLARNAWQAETKVPLVHFNGAGGNVTAGKWNDGAKANRKTLADRVAAGMQDAWNSTEREPISARQVSWKVEPVALPISPFMDEAALLKVVDDADAKPGDRFSLAQDLIWLKRCQRGDKVDIGCLALANARILFMPGELFVEYQLWAQETRPDLFVAMAAYGEYGPGYIGTKISYSQGGYETGATASHTAPEVEDVLMAAIRKLLDSPAK